MLGRTAIGLVLALLVALLTEWAKEDGRSRANLVNWLLRKAIKGRQVPISQ